MLKKQNKATFMVGDYSDITMDELESEFHKLHDLSLTNRDIGAIETLEQSFFILAEQLELVYEMKRRTGKTNDELNRMFGPVIYPDAPSGPMRFFGLFGKGKSNK